MRYDLLGLGFVQGWLWISFLSGPLLYRLRGSSPVIESLILTFLFFNALTYLCAACWGRCFFGLKYQNVGLAGSTLLMVLGTLLLGLNPAAAPAWLYVFAAASAGIGSAIFIVALGELYSSLSIQQASLYFSLAVLIGTLLYFAAVYLPVHIALYFTAAIPAAALFCYFSRSNVLLPSSQNGIFIPHAETNPAPASVASASAMRFPYRLMLLLIVYYLAGGLMYRVVLLLPSFSSHQLFWNSSVVYCVIALLAGLFVYKQAHIDLSSLYRPILAILGTGFLLLPFLNDGWLFIPFLLFQSGFALFDIYIWLLLIRLSNQWASPWRVFGWGFFGTTASILLASLLYKLWLPVLTVYSSRIEALSIAAASLMFVASLIFEGNKGNKGTVLLPPLIDLNNEAKEPSPGLEIAAVVEDHLAILAADLGNNYGLTKREMEVLQQLLRGYNNPRICTELNISANTLKTHLRNIYRKTEVNDRQQLMDLVHKKSV